LNPSITKKLWNPPNPSKIISFPQTKEIKKRIINLKNRLKRTPYLKNKTKELVKLTILQKTK
jgi:hypothetical protein